MTVIFETDDFTVKSRDKPHITRKDGGHITIAPKTHYCTRQDLTPYQAIELMRLTTVVGKAMTVVLNRRGVDIGRINYQDNGNWSVFSPEGPALHIHLYGRAKSATIQKYGQALYFPHIEEQPEFYEKNEPLTPEDISEIQGEIAALLNDRRYANDEWKLS